IISSALFRIKTSKTTPKDNDDDELIKEFNKLKKTLNSAKQQLQQEKVLIHNLNDDDNSVNVKNSNRFNRNNEYRSGNLMVEPILNNKNKSDSNTSIKASNEMKCNLIAGDKMINNVSKSSTTTTISAAWGEHNSNNKQIDDKTTTTTTTTIRAERAASGNCGEGGKNAAAAATNITARGNNDFHKAITAIATTTTTTTTTCTSTTTTITKTKTFTTTDNETHMPPEAHNTIKCMRHKNITCQHLSDSYQRTLDVSTLNVATKENSQCELLELNSDVKQHPHTPQKDYNNQQQDDQLKFKTLAERKALLKQEFFKDLNTAYTQDNLQKPLKSSIQQQPLNKRILKKQHNLKLKIPSHKDCTKQTNKQDLSLVALRKLDLQKKQQQQQQQQHTINTVTHNTVKALKNSQFPKVKELALKFDCNKNKNGNNMILPVANKSETTKSNKLEAMVERHSPLSDEGCTIGQSPYSSDDDNDSIRTTHTAIERIPGSKRKDKVARSASSDSALGLDVDEPMDVTEQQQQQQQQQQQKRRMTLTVTDLPLRPALLPLAEPTLLPDSPSLEMAPQTLAVNALQPAQIPSKVLLEERVVEIPEDPRSGRSSRRESSQSCASDWPTNEMQGVRFVRTPSVVVSDYSDDITCGITLEEIEYFRAQRLRRRRSSLETSGTEKDALDNNSDISASSSCSNLYYCGSTISALDGAECLVNGVRFNLERKTSDCSTCSVSGDEDASNNFTIPEQPEDCQDITDMLANQHLTSKRCKKKKKRKNQAGLTSGCENKKILKRTIRVCIVVT
ncbi:hypothetical protein DOY81_005197, partial [Sarcophaga bullata]